MGFYTAPNECSSASNSSLDALGAVARLVASRVELNFLDLSKVCVIVSYPMLSLTLPDYMSGKLKVDEYVTHHRTLSEINEGFHDMHVCIKLSNYHV